MQGLVYCPRCHFPVVLMDGRFRLTRRLATGGFGIVYRADDLATKDEAVVKVIKPEFFEKESASIRFSREIRWTERLSAESPHIVRYLSHGKIEGLGHFYAMEFLKGITLEHRVLEPRALPFSESFAIFRQLCNAVGVAHRNNVVHRDLKPDNIFLVREGESESFVKVLDFGIAKPLENTVHQSLTQGILGTPSYLSPEQCRNHNVDHRSDIYSMGVILYELITREQLFPADKERMMEVVQQHLFAKPTPMRERRPDLDIPEPLEAAVFKALEKEAAERYQSVEEFMFALEPFADLPGVATHPSTPLPRGIHPIPRTDTGEGAYLRTEDVSVEPITIQGSGEQPWQPSPSLPSGTSSGEHSAMDEAGEADTEEDLELALRQNAPPTFSETVEEEHAPQETAPWLWMVVGVLAGLAGLLVWKAVQISIQPLPVRKKTNVSKGNKKSTPRRLSPQARQPLEALTRDAGNNVSPERRKDDTQVVAPLPKRKSNRVQPRPVRRKRRPQRTRLRRRFRRRTRRVKRVRPVPRRRPSARTQAVHPKLKVCGTPAPKTYWVRGINSHSNPIDVKPLGCSGCRLKRKGDGICIQIPQALKSVNVRVKVEGFVTCHHSLGAKRSVVRWKLKVFDLTDVVDKNYPCFQSMR